MEGFSIFVSILFLIPGILGCFKGTFIAAQISFYCIMIVYIIFIMTMWIIVNDKESRQCCDISNYYLPWAENNGTSICLNTVTENDKHPEKTVWPNYCVTGKTPSAQCAMLTS